MRTFLRHRVLGAAFVGSLALVVGGWLWTYFTLRHIREPLILHWVSDLPRPVDQIGGMQDITAIGSFGLLAVLLNFMIVLALEKRNWFWGKVLAAGTVFLVSLIFITFAAIISVN